MTVELLLASINEKWEFCAKGVLECTADGNRTHDLSRVMVSILKQADYFYRFLFLPFRKYPLVLGTGTLPELTSTLRKLCVVKTGVHPSYTGHLIVEIPKEFQKLYVLFWILRSMEYLSHCQLFRGD